MVDAKSDDEEFEMAQTSERSLFTNEAKAGQTIHGSDQQLQPIFRRL
jgi:hypothetical protein